jgi:hypothetical protein
MKNAVDYLKGILPRDKVMPGKKAWRNPTKQPKGFK